MTPRQRALARHALGLPNRQKQSYRNRFVVAYCPGDYDHWAAMESAGLADCSPRIIGGRRHFWLTPEGAKAALEHGETLDPEDFPE